MRLASACDAMIIVGGRQSSNTAKLKAVCENCCPTYLIETAKELSQIDLSGCEQIAPGCIIVASCSFGELVIKVPKRYHIEADAGTSFGNFEVEGTSDPDPVAVINLDANVSFGEIRVEYI
jgi:hypothetical protein